MSFYRCEPDLREILADPVTRAVMRADGVDVPSLEAELRALARRRKGTRPPRAASAGAQPCICL